MKTLCLVAIATALMFTLGRASAEDPTRSCASFIRAATTINVTVKDEQEFIAQAAAFCSEYSSSSKRKDGTNIGVAVDALAASFGQSSKSSSSIASKVCAGKDSASVSKDAYRNYIRSIAPRAYDSYDRCLEASQSEMTYTLGRLYEKQFSMTASFLGRTKSSATLQATPMQGISCKWEPNARGSENSPTVTLKGSLRTSNLICERTNGDTSGTVRIVRTDESKARPIEIDWETFKNGVPVSDLKEIAEGMISLRAGIESGEIVAGRSKLVDQLPPKQKNCKWKSVPTHGNFICPAKQYVAGVCFTNNEIGCDEATGKGHGQGTGVASSTWVSGGGVYCCDLGD